MQGQQQKQQTLLLKFLSRLHENFQKVIRKKKKNVLNTERSGDKVSKHTRWEGGLPKSWWMLYWIPTEDIVKHLWSSGQRFSILTRASGIESHNYWPTNKRTRACSQRQCAFPRYESEVNTHAMAGNIIRKKMSLSILIFSARFLCTTSMR